MYGKRAGPYIFAYNPTSARVPYVYMYVLKHMAGSHVLSCAYCACPNDAFVLARPAKPDQAKPFQAWPGLSSRGQAWARPPITLTIPIVYKDIYIYMYVYNHTCTWVNIYGAYNICMNMYGESNICMSICRAYDICMNMYGANHLCMEI